ncbi:MAG: type II secretion system protein [Clostridia bacterium]|nr:type II secretion system protein [Clostridia bacterium]
MKNTKRSAFTIVELVIVIAVIAILSAVLIPTFGSIIKDATIAADQTAMHILNTELQMYLEDETIDSEAELMEVLKDSGLDKKLVTKSMAHGYYYWFNMATQSFVIGTTNEIAAEPAPAPQAQNKGSAQLMSAVTVADGDANEPKYANIYTFREFFGNGYYFVSCTNGDGFGLSEAISFIDELRNGQDYDKLIKYFEYAMKNDADTSAVKIVYDLVKDTNIRNHNGVFYHGDTSIYEYISPKATRLTGPSYQYVNGEVTKKFKAPMPTSGEYIYIPDNIKMILKDAFSYEADGDKVMKVGMPTVEATLALFGPYSSNKTSLNIEVEGKSYYVNNMILYEIVGTGKKKAGDLKQRLEFGDTFCIGFESINDGVIEYNKDADTIYVSYGEGTLQLVAVNPQNSDEVSYTAYEWSISEKSNLLNSDGSTSTSGILDQRTGLIDLTKTHFKENTGKYICEFTVKAKARKLSDGTDTTDTVKVVVIKPVSATLSFGDSTIALGGENTAGPALEFTGYSASYGLSVSVNYSTDSSGSNPLLEQLGGAFDIDTNDGKLISLHYDGTNMSFKTNAKGELVAEKDRNDEPYYSFEVSIGGALKTTVTGNIVDKTSAPVRFNYKKYNQANCPTYQLGTVNDIKLSDLFSISAGAQAKGGSAKVTIYCNAPVNGKFDPTGEIRKVVAENAADALENGYENPYTLDIIYPTNAISYSDWSNAAHVITLQGEVGTNGDLYENLYIEIAPTEGDVTTIAKVEIVDGAVNVTDLNSLKPTDGEGNVTSNAIVLNQNVVLHGTSEITTGTTIEIGKDITLHGNGHVINAEKYEAENTGVTENKYNYLDKSKTYCNDPNCPNYAPNNEKEWVKDVCYTEKWTFKFPKHSHRVVKNGENIKSTYSTFPGYKTNQAMIILSGGTIDNIYVNGPIYPELQYRADDSYDTNTVSGVTGYYVSGIKTTGDATIKNSYVIGFRQPVQVESAATEGHYEASGNTTTLVIDKQAETTTLMNTVLRGGNYANLVIVSGNIVLEDVTTIQDYNGMTPTIGDKSKNVYGAGIVLEGTTAPSNEKVAEAMALPFVGDEEAKILTLLRPLSTKVEIKGDLTQHNWLEKDTANKNLPNIQPYNGFSIGLKEIFGYFFNGFGIEEMNVGRMGRFMDYIHQDANLSLEENRITNTYYAYGAKDPNANKNEMLNFGILFVDVEQNYNDSVINEHYAKLMVNIDESERNGGKQFGTVSVQLSHESMKGLTAADLRTKGADVSLVIWSYTDGRKWAQTSETRTIVGLGEVPYYSYYTTSATDWNNINVVTDSDKYYSPNALYGSNGAYSAWYGSKN